MSKDYKPKICEMCSLEYKPTGSAQKFCPPCGKQNVRDKSLEYYYNNSGRAYSRQYKRARSQTFVDIEDYVSVEGFKKMVKEVVDTRRGSILSTKTTMRRLLKKLDIYEDAWLQKRNRGGLAISFYEMIHSVFKEEGGHYFGTTCQAGDQYQFPLKERKK